jgi:hypothetical protein
MEEDMRVKTVIKRIVLGIAISVVALWIIGFILIKTGYEPPAKPEPAQEALTETPRQEPVVPIEPQGQPQAEQTQEIETSPVLTEIPQANDSQQQAMQTQPENLLMKAKLQEAPVLNDQKQRIGTMAYIIISEKDLLGNVSFEDCGEFYRSFQGKNYNWVSIICPEGTGLVFPGAGHLASYGKLDQDGRLAEDIHWTITYDENTGAFKEFERDTRFLPKKR